MEIGSQDGDETVVASTNKTRRNPSALSWALGSLEILTLTSDRNQLNACRAKEERQGCEPGPWSRRGIDSRLSNQRPVRLMMQSLPCGPWTRATGYDNGGQGMGSRLTNSEDALETHMVASDERKRGSTGALAPLKRHHWLISSDGLKTRDFGQAARLMISPRSQACTHMYQVWRALPWCRSVWHGFLSTVSGLSKLISMYKSMYHCSL